jgi:hypothetical protein
LLYNEERPHSAIGNKAPIELIDVAFGKKPSNLVQGWGAVQPRFNTLYGWQRWPVTTGVTLLGRTIRAESGDRHSTAIMSTALLLPEIERA